MAHLSYRGKHPMERRAQEPSADLCGAVQRSMDAAGKLDSYHRRNGARPEGEMVARWQSDLLSSDRYGFRCIWARNLDPKPNCHWSRFIRWCICMIRVYRCRTYPIAGMSASA